MLECIGSSKFVSHKARISREFGLRKNLQLRKLEWLPQTLVKLSYGEFWDSKLCCLSTFDNMAISVSQSFTFEACFHCLDQA